MKYLQIILDHWAQATVLVTAIGYVLKQYSDFQTKKLEVKYSLWYKSKLEAILVFTSNFQTFLDATTPHNVFFHEKDAPKEILENIKVLIKAFKLSFFHVLAFLHDDEIPLYQSLYSKTIKMNSIIRKTSGMKETTEETLVAEEAYYMLRVEAYDILMDLFNHNRDHFTPPSRVEKIFQRSKNIVKRLFEFKGSPNRSKTVVP